MELKLKELEISLIKIKEKKLTTYCYAIKNDAQGFPTYVVYKECTNQKKNLFKTTLCTLGQYNGHNVTLARLQDEFTRGGVNRTTLWHEPHLNVIHLREAFNALLDLHEHNKINYPIVTLP